MVILLRVIRQSRWLDAYNITGMTDDDFPADPLGDLQTRGNALSVFEVPDADDAKSIAVAVAAGRESIANIDYVLFESVSLGSLGIRVEKSEGVTPNTSINQLHSDLVDLTARKLVGLAQVMAKGHLKRITWKEVEAEIIDGIRGGYLDKVGLKESLMNKVVDKL